jgi:hypothetical protein
MFPDYPEIKRKLQSNFHKFVDIETQNDQLIKMFKKKPIYEGKVLEITRVNGDFESMEFQPIMVEFKIKPEDLIEKGVDAYYSKIPEVAEEMRKEKSKFLIENVGEITSRTGNIVNLNKPTGEWYLEALENGGISFDEFGFSSMPDIFVNPKDYDRIISDFSKLESDPNIKQKIKEIIESKRREWIDKENNRKLVD